MMPERHGRSSDESPEVEKRVDVTIDSAVEYREWSGPKELAAVMIAICLSVFLVALVGCCRAIVKATLKQCLS